ncbi:MAG: thiamine ABC transporter substrate binding subunit [Halobaculum sp.]
MERRRFITAAGAGVAGLAAGCSARRTDEGSTVGTTGGGATTLRVGTYGSFIDAPSTSPGGWLKKQFESEFDATLEWFAPEGGMDYFLTRRKEGVTIDTDLYLGLTPENLVRADRGVEGDQSLFTNLDTSALSNADAVIDDYRFDPRNRAIPFGASYISLVYNQLMFDERGVEAPTTFDDLTADPYRDALLVPNPQNSETGLEFLFWTVDQFGADGFLDYWSQLVDNGATILKGWSAAYSAYSDGEAPAVVSYSTDQVYATRYDQNIKKHQVGFLNGEGYAYLEGVAPFAGTEKMGLAEQFVDFVLQPDIQAEIAQRNVALPAVSNATLPSDYDELVYEPETVVSYSYDELSGNMETWLSEWSKEIAG